MKALRGAGNGKPPKQQSLWDDLSDTGFRGKVELAPHTENNRQKSTDPHV
jgi:hypothetical protein